MDEHRIFPAHRAHVLNDEQRLAALSEEGLVTLLDLDGTEDIADLGSGTGFYTNRIAAHTSGTVYAVEVQSEMQDHHRARCLPANVQMVLGDVDELPLPEGSIDRAVSINTFHEAHGHDGLVRLARALREGGRLLIVDWRRDPAATAQGPRLEARLTKEEAASLLSPHFRTQEVRDLGEFFFSVVATPAHEQRTLD